MKAGLTHYVPSVETLKYRINITLLNTHDLFNDSFFPGEMYSEFKEVLLRTQLSHHLYCKLRLTQRHP